mmetsp:Transcript_33267/g.41847  ORF Transcript_33267/g.41847 Transcript_33267/m.41847 type:complete len:276 (+) Transcript_33267:123-950(+)
MDNNPLFAADEGDFDDPSPPPAPLADFVAEIPVPEQLTTHVVENSTSPAIVQQEQKAEEVTLDPQLQIVQRLLSSSPPGQIDLILSDIEKLLPGKIISEELKQTMFRAYNLSTMRLINTEDQKMILHHAGEVDGAHFVDPATNTVREINHVTAAVVGEPRPYEVTSTLEPARSALQKALGGYAREHYSQPSTEFAWGCYVAPPSQGALGLVVALKAERLNLRNLWAGSWQAEFFLPLAASPAAGTAEKSLLTGTIQIHGHYFDEGNIQLQTKKRD